MKVAVPSAAGIAAKKCQPKKSRMEDRVLQPRVTPEPGVMLGPESCNLMVTVPLEGFVQVIV